MTYRDQCNVLLLWRVATIIGKALDRTTPKKIEHWAKIGKIMEDNPDLSYEFVKQAVIAKAEIETGELERYDFG